MVNQYLDFFEGMVNQALGLDFLEVEQEEEAAWCTRAKAPSISNISTATN